MKVVRPRDDDAESSAIAFFSIEGFHGGNTHTEYVAALTRSKRVGGHPSKISLLGVIPIGRRGIRTVKSEDARIEERGDGFDVIVPALVYGPSDPMCCPSVGSQVRIRVTVAAGGSLTELR